MSKELLQLVIDEGVEYNLNSFFCAVSNDYSEIEDDLSDYNKDGFTNFQAIGDIVFSANEKLVVVTAKVGEDLTERSGKKAQYEKVKKILKDYMKYDAGIFVFSDPEGSFRFSLVYGQAEGIRKSWSNFRRFTYFASRDQTNNTFLARVGGCDFSSLDTIKDAFSVEKVNKEFYKEISKYYYRLTGKNGYGRDLVLPSVKEDDDKKYEEYAVRLIGRIIFCWFLKHKKSVNGIPLIPQEALSVSAVQNHTNYYHSILEPLFFEVMNKPVKDRKPVTISQSDNIPFLNGGLFDQHVNDYYHNMPNPALIIPNRWFEDFLGVLERYNFTIDENSIVDADVSVDPEMLGRIFENLLAEVVPETGETARKSTGSYYTPRVIVDYMVEQSLKQYLLTKTALPEDKLNNLLSYEDDSIDLAESERNAVVIALKEIKIIDPACGSGAFPMGILHRMLLILEKVDTRLEIWRRLYLSTYHPVMRRIIEDKLRKGNEQYIRKLTVIQDSIYGVDIQPIAVDIAKLRCFLSLVVDEIVLDNEENRGIEPLPNLEFKFVAANTLIGLPSIAGQSAFGITATVSNLKELREAYLRSFGAEKLQIEKEFRATQQKLFEENVEWALSDIQVKRLTEWDPFSYQPSGWIDPEWMFGVSDGFDVILANPPYIVLSSDQMSGYKFTKGNNNTYVAFIEGAIKIVRAMGVIAYIIPTTWMAGNNFLELRRYLITNKAINQIIQCPYDIFSSAYIDNVVLIINGKSVKNNLVKTFKFSIREDFEQGIKHEMFIADEWNEGNECIVFLNKALVDVLKKYREKASIELGEIAKVQRGTLPPKENEIFTVPYNNYKRGLIPWFNGQVYRYLIVEGNNVYVDYDSLRENKDRELFLCPKILGRQLISRQFRLQFTYYDKPGAFKKNLYAIYSLNKEYDYYFLLAILNSKYFSYIQVNLNTSGQRDDFPAFSLQDFKKFLIPKLSLTAQKPFIDIVEKIITNTRDNDYPDNASKQIKIKDFENQIDRMVYDLYGLTPEEKVVVAESIAGK